MRNDLPRTWPDYYRLDDVKVVDGDTIKGRIILPFEHSFFAPIRLKDWYADEPEGHFYQTGREAKARLEAWIKDRHLLLQCNKPRLDRYGRVLGRLWSEGRVWTPQQVLGSLALTKQEHARRLVVKRMSPQVLRAAQSSTPAQPVPLQCTCEASAGPCSIPGHDSPPDAPYGPYRAVYTPGGSPVHFRTPPSQ